MTRNKQVLCKVCYKEMRSDHLNRHMKVHETMGGSKRRHNEMEDEDVVEAVHKGMMGNTYERGRYSPSMEQNLHHFHCLLFDQLNS